MVYKLHLIILISITITLSNGMWYMNSPYGILYPSLYTFNQYADQSLNYKPNEETKKSNELFNFDGRSIRAPLPNVLGKKDEKKTQAKYLPSMGPLSYFRPNQDLAKLFAPNLDQGRYLIPKFINPMSVIKNKFSKGEMEDPEAKRNETCISKGGTYFNGECYQYFGTDATFTVARSTCMMRGGDLWTPDFTDAYLFNKLMDNMPEVASAPENRVWIGGMLNEDSAMDINGVDITNTYFIGVNFFIDADEDECLVYSFVFGYQVAGNDDCTSDENPFICELDITEETKPSDEPDSIVFNKFNLFKKWV